MLMLLLLMLLLVSRPQPNKISIREHPSDLSSHARVAKSLLRRLRWHDLLTLWSHRLRLTG